MTGWQSDCIPLWLFILRATAEAVLLVELSILGWIAIFYAAGVR